MGEVEQQVLPTVLLVFAFFFLFFLAYWLTKRLLPSLHERIKRATSLLAKKVGINLEEIDFGSHLKEYLLTRCLIPLAPYFIAMAIINLLGSEHLDFTWLVGFNEVLILCMVILSIAVYDENRAGRFDERTDYHLESMFGLIFLLGSFAVLQVLLLIDQVQDIPRLLDPEAVLLVIILSLMISISLGLVYKLRLVTTQQDK